MFDPLASLALFHALSLRPELEGRPLHAPPPRPPRPRRLPIGPAVAAARALLRSATRLSHALSAPPSRTPSISHARRLTFRPTPFSPRLPDPREIASN